MEKKKHIDIVIIDDNKLFKLAIKANLEQHLCNSNVKLHVYDIGEKSVERIKRDLPEIVILDYHLDSEVHQAADGIVVLDEILKISPKSKVIMLTGDSNIDVVIKSFLHGASDYVVKEELQFEKINNAVSRVIKTIEVQEEDRYRAVGRNSLMVLIIILLLLNLYFSIDFH